jgi:light-harvesting complex 1 beta chain
MTERADKGSLAFADAADRLSFYVIFVVGFVVLLAIALMAQLMMLKWRAWLPGAEGSRSLVEGVRSAVYTFMSYLT